MIAAMALEAANENFTAEEWQEINAQHDFDMLCSMQHEPYDDE